MPDAAPPIASQTSGTIGDQNVVAAGLKCETLLAANGRVEVVGFVSLGMMRISRR